MKIEEIRRRVSAEHVLDASEYLTQVKELIKGYPNGIDFQVNQIHLIPSLEVLCDTLGIPFYHVTENTCSVAKTYTALYIREINR